MNESQSEELKILLEIKRILQGSNIKFYLAYGTALGAVRHKGFIPWDSDIDIALFIDDYEEAINVLSINLNEEYVVLHSLGDGKYESLLGRVAKYNGTHTNLHIDIFPLVGTPNNWVIRKIFCTILFYLFRIYYVKNVNSQIYKNNKKKFVLLHVCKVLVFPFQKEGIRKIFSKLQVQYSIEKSEFIYNSCGSYRNKEIIPKDIFSETIEIEFEGQKFPIMEKWDLYLKHFYKDYMTPKQVNYI